MLRLLTLAKRIVEAHGGGIEITSSVGKGTRARVWIPAKAPIASPDRSRTSAG